MLDGKESNEVILSYSDYIMSQKASLFGPQKPRKPSFDYKSHKHVLNDRKSKYTVTWWKVTSKEEAKEFVKAMVKNKEFSKATHNTYAWRSQLADWWIIEGKSDDGESGAGMCILKEMQRGEIVNCIVVVSRYYGRVKLHADRFKNVMEVSRGFIECLE